jgi:cyanate permease
MKKQNPVRVFKLASVLTLTVFLTGIVVPSLMRMGSSADHASSLIGSLYTTKVAGFTFAYKLQNILAAILGAGFGGVMAFIAYVVLEDKNHRSVASARSLDENAGAALRSSGGSKVFSTLVGGLFALFRIEA